MAQYDSPLSLVTPHIRGQRVKDAQWLLIGHNAFATKPHPIHPYQGAIDGEYGPKTYAATKSAKYWLGYAPVAIDGRFGQTVYELLKGDLVLPQEYVERRQDRLKELNVPLKLKALQFAETQIGTKESPYGSNRQKYGEWYGMNGVAWCAIFDSFCLDHVGFKLLNGRPWKYSYVPTIYEDAKYGRNRMSLTHHPQPGDLVTYNFHGIPNAHVAFFKGWANNSDYFFWDLGGNTGPINMSNGGEVLSQERNMSQVTGFVRLT